MIICKCLVKFFFFFFYQSAYICINTKMCRITSYFCALLCSTQIMATLRSFMAHTNLTKYRLRYKKIHRSKVHRCCFWNANRKKTMQVYLSWISSGLVACVNTTIQQYSQINTIACDVPSVFSSEVLIPNPIWKLVIFMCKRYITIYISLLSLVSRQWRTRHSSSSTLFWKTYQFTGLVCTKSHLRTWHSFL